MKLRLREEPREWRKFATAGVVFLEIVWWLISRQRGWESTLLLSGALALAAAWAVAMVRPRLVRPIYRGAMTLAFHVGQVMGRVLLAFFFLLVLTPMGLVLRGLGFDLLQLRRPKGRETYWEPARPDGPLDRLS